MAARSIAENKDYEKLIKWIVSKNTQLYEFRKTYEKLDNKDYDLMIASLKMPGLRSILYDTPLNVVKHGSFALRPFNKK